MENLPNIFNTEVIDVIIPQNNAIQDAIEYLEPYFINIKNDIEFLSGNEYMDEDYSRHSLKRVSAKNCTFNICLFTKAAGTGSIWSGTKFIDCNLSNANFEFCDFSGSYFITKIINLKTKIEGSNFSSSNFTKATFNNIEIIGSSFTNADFSDATIENCNISSSTFENSKLNNTVLRNLKLSNLNFEYVDVRKTIFDNVEFSFMQFAYIIGITKEAISDGRIKITANSKVLTFKELNRTVKHLVSYFHHHNNFFPLLNLCLIFEMEDLFKTYMKHAVNISIADENYRILKYLTKLINISNHYSSEEKSDLFEYIQSKQSLNLIEVKKQAYITHKAEIESFLLPIKKEDLILEFKSIDNFSFEILHQMLELYTRAEVVIEWLDIILSKNSPIKLKAIINDNKTDIALFLQFTALVFAGISAYNSTFSDKEKVLNTNQQNIAITIHKEYITKLNVQNVLIRNNVINILNYNVNENNTLNINTSYMQNSLSK